MDERMKMESDTNPFRRYHTIVDDVSGFEASLRRPLPGFIWTQTLRISPAELGALLKQDGFYPTPLSWHPAAFRIEEKIDGIGKHWAYFAGLYHIQEASSMIPGLVLSLKPEDRVLDLCAAPGNKAAQAALALQNRGTVVANDLIRERLQPLRANLNRLGFFNTSITQYDGVNYPKTAGPYDWVL
ncbi:MAG: RNA methyltransferase, partial [Proteobacteria bacterium]|nr:RNA methyltransferase [Pseudomonadota bacterium]